MSLEIALRLTEILLGFAFIQQSVEHLRLLKHEQCLFLPRFLLSLLLVVGFYPSFLCLALLIHALFILHRYQGPYNGGSDRMALLILSCLCLAHFMPSVKWQEVVFGYLAIQLVLSYFIAGWVKIMNPEWRNGRALQDVFRFSAYPVSEHVRKWSDWPRLLCAMSWAVMLLELLFPLALLTYNTLVIGLVGTALFHFGNACLFGLNRFFWIWLTAYPSLFWLQHRIFITT